MSMFTQRHYEAIAAVLSENKDYTVGAEVVLAVMFKRDNPKFNANRFYKAVDVMPEVGEDGWHDEDVALTTALRLLFDGKPTHAIMASLRQVLPRR